MSRPHLDVAGTSIDCADPVQLGQFYLALLGGEVLWENPESVGLRTRSGLNIVAQKVANYIPPVWPSTSIVHFDLDAGGTSRDLFPTQSNAAQGRHLTSRTPVGAYSSTLPDTPSASPRRCTTVEAILRWANPQKSN